MRLNILIERERVAGIVLNFERDHPLPALVVSFGDAVPLVATHELYLDAQFHRWPQLLDPESRRHTAYRHKIPSNSPVDS
jgi:hypothetical protein